MSEPNDDYHARAGMYRLLVAYGTMALTNDPKGPAVYRSTLETVLIDAQARDIVTHLVGAAFGGYIEKHNGDAELALETIVRELRAAADLESLDQHQGEDRPVTDDECPPADRPLTKDERNLLKWIIMWKMRESIARDTGVHATPASVAHALRKLIEKSGLHKNYDQHNLYVITGDNDQILRCNREWLAFHAHHNEQLTEQQLREAMAIGHIE